MARRNFEIKRDAWSRFVAVLSYRYSWNFFLGAKLDPVDRVIFLKNPGLRCLPHSAYSIQVSKINVVFPRFESLMNSLVCYISS